MARFSARDTRQAAYNLHIFLRIRLADVGPPSLGGRVDARQIDMFLACKLAATFACVAAIGVYAQDLIKVERSESSGFSPLLPEGTEMKPNAGTFPQKSFHQRGQPNPRRLRVLKSSCNISHEELSNPTGHPSEQLVGALHLQGIGRLQIGKAEGMFAAAQRLRHARSWLATACKGKSIALQSEMDGAGTQEKTKKDLASGPAQKIILGTHVDVPAQHVETS